MKQTKIVCSISDRHCDVDFLRQLFFSGMNVVRMNTAHATQDGIREIIRNTRAVSPHLALLIDTKGPDDGAGEADSLPGGRHGEDFRSS